MSQATTFYNWRKRSQGMGVDEVGELTEKEERTIEEVTG
jgi:hypothetical protein